MLNSGVICKEIALRNDDSDLDSLMGRGNFTENIQILLLLVKPHSTSKIHAIIIFDTIDSNVHSLEREGNRLLV